MSTTLSQVNLRYAELCKAIYEYKDKDCPPATVVGPAPVAGRGGYIITNGEHDVICGIHTNPEETIVTFQGGTTTADELLRNAKRYRIPFPAGGKVHSGFYTALMSVYHELYPLIADAERLAFIGHSAGGALAQLCAVHTAAKRWDDYTRKYMSCVTFAAPRVGDTMFGLMAKQLLDRVILVEHYLDPVPRIPTAGYRKIVKPAKFMHWGLRQHSIESYIKTMERVCR